ncbi:MAG: rhodanese-like domain-containing protein [Magnetococcales bacterium]|nr:rhodanese-like domain-containing protein [Magnetococcales bacterium]
MNVSENATSGAGLPSAPHSPLHAGFGQLTPQEAFEFISNNPDALFVDVRMELEHFFVGHPQGVVNIPWQEYPDFEINPDFVKEVSHLAKKEQPVVLICRSGHRSIDAGNALMDAGFIRVYNVLEGFEGDRDGSHHRSSLNGWRFRGLPWVQC